MVKTVFPKQITNRATALSYALLLLLALLFQQVSAQQTTPPPSSPAETVSAGAALQEFDSRYRIGPGDVLDIRVIAGQLSPELSNANVVVENDGMIRIPLIENDVQAACLSTTELADHIRTLYKRYKTNPHVEVFVKEYNSRPVAVIGAIGKPGQFQLRRRVRLLELLTLAGGPTAVAGGRIQVVRAPGGFTCDATAAPQAPGAKQPAPASESARTVLAAAEDPTGSLIFYNLSDTLKGIDSANPYVEQGDIINLPEAEQAYVVGNVLRPMPIPLKERVTLSQAIAMAGGTLPDTKKNIIHIIRQEPGSVTKKEITVDLNAINQRKAEDIALQGNDIIEVPISGGKRLFRSLVGAVVPTVGQLPIQVIR